MKPSEDLIERMKANDRYQKMIDAAPEEVREKIRLTVEAFLKELGEGLDSLKERINDPDVKKELQEKFTKRNRENGVK